MIMKTLAAFCLGAIGAALVWSIGVNYRADMNLGSAQDGFPGVYATSSPITVSPTPVTVFSATTSCSSRSVSTTGKTVMITMADGLTPTASFGIVQPASTTVSYDATSYGCGVMKVYGFDSASVITVAEFR